MAQHVLIQRNFVLEEILMHIKAFTAERNATDDSEALKDEWMAVAKVLDRFFMCTFLLFIAVSTFVILIILPRQKVELGPNME